MSPKPSRDPKETHYNRKEQPSGGARKSADQKENRPKPASRPPSEESTERPIGRRTTARPGKDAGKSGDGPRERVNRGGPAHKKASGRGRMDDKDARPERGRKPFDAGRTERSIGNRPGSADRGERSFRKEEDRPGRPSFKKPYSKSAGDEKKPFSRGDKPFRKDEDRPARPASGKPFRKEEDRTDRPAFKKPFGKSSGADKKSFPRGDKPFHKDEDRPGRPASAKPFRKQPGEASRPGPRARKDEDRPFKSHAEPKGEQPDFQDGEDTRTGRKKIDRKEAPGPSRDRKPFSKAPGAPHKPYTGKGKPGSKKPEPDLESQDFYEDERPFLKSGKWNEQAKAGPMTLNKYLAHAGISSRRETAAIVKEGKVKVNGKVMQEPGYRVQPNDVVTMDGKTMTPQRHLVYILLNKPKDFLTTTEDERGRRTVMELVASAGDERLFPVGRLDRNTTGVLLMTNDGDLAQKLSHPSYEIKKIYQVTLDKDLTKKDFDHILSGVDLEDGPAKVDRLAYLEKKHEIGLEIHSGRNRIVRRIFETLGYEVEKLDRVMYAGLTKKNVTRGQWRFLTEKEVILLKHFRNR